MDFPVWLNADVSPGPVSGNPPRVRQDNFLAEASQYFPQATLSLGWNTDLPEDPYESRGY